MVTKQPPEGKNRFDQWISSSGDKRNRIEIKDYLKSIGAKELMQSFAEVIPFNEQEPSSKENMREQSQAVCSESEEPARQHATAWIRPSQPTKVTNGQGQYFGHSDPVMLRLWWGASPAQNQRSMEPARGVLLWNQRKLQQNFQQLEGNVLFLFLKKQAGILKTLRVVANSALPY